MIIEALIEMGAEALVIGSDIKSKRGCTLAIVGFLILAGVFAYVYFSQ